MVDVITEEEQPFKIFYIWIVCDIFSVFIPVISLIALQKEIFIYHVIIGILIFLFQCVFGIFLYKTIQKNKLRKHIQQNISEQYTKMAETNYKEEQNSLFSQKEQIAKDMGNSIAMRSNFFKSVSLELSKSISSSLSSTTEPISAELLRIRKTSKDFLQGIQTFEDEVKNKTALTQVQTESLTFNQELKELSFTVENVFSILDERISKLKTVSAHIGEIAGDISEISEKIRILSFNASIEAARAGKAGSGFRIIANEIKQLSADTEERLVEIHSTLKETKIIFDNIGEGINENKKKMVNVVSERQNGFSAFERLMESYFPRLEKLYAGVIGVIDSLSESMSIISPVVQLHEITSQEIGNLQAVTEDFCNFIDKNVAEVFPNTKLLPDSQTIKNTADAIRKHLTTKDELLALERGINQISPVENFDLGINDKGIEFF